MNTIRLILVNLIAFVVLVAIVEAIFGYWFSGPSLSALNVNINAVRVDEDSPYYPPGTNVIYRRDEHGLRGGFESPDKVTILAVGGSTTNDRVATEGDTWTDVLQARLRELGKQEYVANAGVDGHSTVGHLRSFDLWFDRIPGLDPDYVLLYVGVNDRGVAADTALQPDALTSPSWGRRVSTYISNHSFIVRALRRLRGALVASDIGVTYEFWDFRQQPPDYTPSTLDADVVTSIAEPLAAYRQRLERLHERVLEFEASPIYVTQPVGLVKREEGNLYVVAGSGADLIHLQMQAYNRVLMEFCHSVDAICIDLANELALDITDFYDSIHTTPNGSRKIGDFLAEKLHRQID